MADIIGTLFDVIEIAAIGFFALLGMVIAYVAVFGKRVDKQWEYEADFRDARGRELGEFDIEMSRVLEKKAAVQADYSLKAKFKLRHPAVQVGHRLRVTLDGEVVIDQTLTSDERVLLRNEALCRDIKSAAAGQIVAVEIAGVELFSEPLVSD